MKASKQTRGRAVAAIADQIAVLENSYRSPVTGKIVDKDMRDQIRALHQAIKMITNPFYLGHPSPSAISAYNKALAKAKAKSRVK